MRPRISGWSHPFKAIEVLGIRIEGKLAKSSFASISKPGLEISNGKRTSITDVKIGGHPFEIKTASLGANGTFQFNHVRLDRNYEYLLCLGICPQEIVYNMWRKGDVAEGKAGKLVRMAEGQAVTWKLTKQLSTMIPIEDLPDNLRITLDLPKLT